MSNYGLYWNFYVKKVYFGRFFLPAFVKNSMQNLVIFPFSSRSECLSGTRWWWSDVLAGVINNHIFQTAVVLFLNKHVFWRKKNWTFKKRPSHRQYALFPILGFVLDKKLQFYFRKPKLLFPFFISCCFIFSLMNALDGSLGPHLVA